jgi:hypothetical protein
MLVALAYSAAGYGPFPSRCGAFQMAMNTRQPPGAPAAHLDQGPRSFGDALARREARAAGASARRDARAAFFQLSPVLAATSSPATVTNNLIKEKQGSADARREARLATQQPMGVSPAAPAAPSVGELLKGQHGGSAEARREARLAAGRPMTRPLTPEDATPAAPAGGRRWSADARFEARLAKGTVEMAKPSGAAPVQPFAPQFREGPRPEQKGAQQYAQQDAILRSQYAAAEARAAAETRAAVAAVAAQETALLKAQVAAAEARAAVAEERAEFFAKAEAEAREAAQAGAAGASAAFNVEGGPGWLELLAGGEFEQLGEVEVFSAMSEAAVKARWAESPQTG